MLSGEVAASVASRLPALANRCPADVVILDMPAASSTRLREQIDVFDLIPACGEMGYGVTIISVISTSYAPTESISRMLDFCGDTVRWVVVKNQYFAPEGLKDSFSLWEESKERKRIKKYGGVEIELPRLADTTFKAMQANYTPFTLNELLLRMEALERVHQQDVAHIRVSLDQWQDITQSLSRLLEVRTQETAEVSSGYRTLGEHLVRFGQYLVSSEVMLKRAEGPLTNLATSLPSLIVEMEKLGSQVHPVSDPQITTEVKAELLALRRSIQRSASQGLGSGSGTSIWTELGQWRAAVV